MNDNASGALEGAFGGVAKTLNEWFGDRVNQQMQAQSSQDSTDDTANATHDAYRPLMEQLWPGKSDAQYRAMARNPKALERAIQSQVSFTDAQARLKQAQGTFQDRQDEKNAAKSDQDEKNQQSLYEKGAARLTSIRGDNALKSAETMRDGAISALATINKAEDKDPQGIMNPTEYVDTISQLYRAKNGSTPDVESLKKMRQDTLSGNYGSAYTFLTGKTAPATSKDVQKALKEFVLDAGDQADRLHEGYMNPRNFVDPGLKGKYLDQLNEAIQQGRGTTFKDYRAKYFKDFDSVDEALATKPKPGEILQVRGRRFKAQ